MRSITIAPAFPAELRASNTSPGEIGGVVSLSTSALSSVASYSWTGPSGYAQSGRAQQLNPFTEAMAGTYTVTFTATGGCTATATTEVTIANCDIYIESKNAANEETYKLARSQSTPGTFEPLDLNILPFTGSNTFSAYNIMWMYDGNPIANAPNKPTISVDKPGKYTAVLSLKMNPSNICETEVQISSTPCNVYSDSLGCAVPSNIELPNVLANGVSIAPGDEFTAGDYTVVVTAVTSGSSAGWFGKGYVEMRLVNGIVAKKISIYFEDAVINDCYELAGGSVITEYDPNWGNVIDLDPENPLNPLGENPNQAETLIANNDRLSEILEIFTCSTEQRAELNKIISENDELAQKAQQNEDYSPTQKAELLAGVNLITSNINSLLACCTTNARVREACIAPNEIINNLNTSSSQFVNYPKFEFKNFTFDIIEELHLNGEGKSEYYYFLDFKVDPTTNKYATFKVNLNGFQTWEIYPVKRGDNIAYEGSFVASNGKLPMSQSWNNFLVFFPGLKVDDYWYMGRLLKYLPDGFTMPTLHNKWIALFNGAKAKESTAEAAIYYELIADLPELGYLGFTAFKNFKIAKTTTATAYRTLKNIQSKISSIPQSVRNVLSKIEIDEVIQDAKSLASAISQPQAFIDGKNFEKFILNLINSLDNGYYNKVLTKIGVDLRNYTRVEQVQIWVGNKWIIADNVFYKRLGTTQNYEAIINECKLSSGTALSDNQEAFLNALKSGQKKFKVRSLARGPVAQGQEVTIKGFYKTFGPQGSYDIIKLF